MEEGTLSFPHQSTFIFSQLVSLLAQSAKYGCMGSLRGKKNPYLTEMKQINGF